MSGSTEKAGSRLPEGDLEDRETLKVEDRRHWARASSDDEEDADGPVSTTPTLVDQLRERAEAAERRLQEYIEAFKEAQAEQEQVRARLARDVERRVELRFGSLVGQLLESMDDLDLALDHARDVDAAKPLADGVALARDRFLAALETVGVERVDPLGDPFDPNSAEALRVDSVDDPERDGVVTETLRPGYRIGDHVVRPARVAVARLTPGT